MSEGGELAGTWAELMRNTAGVFNAIPRQDYFASYQTQLRAAQQQAQQQQGITAEQWQAFRDSIILRMANPPVMHQWPKILDLSPGV